MACAPFIVPAGLFDNSTQSAWSNAASTSQGGKSVTLSNGNLTATGPNGSTHFSAAASQTLRYKFFGTGNFLAVLKSDVGPGPITHRLSIVNFTAPSTISVPVLTIGSMPNLSLPFVQPSVGPGVLCLIGGATPSGTAGLGIFRSDNGESICSGPPPFTPSQMLFGKVTGTSVQIVEGGNPIGGPCPLPSGSLHVEPTSQTFSDVVIGGCPAAASTKTFKLTNDGNDCLTVSAIANAGPYTVTNIDPPLPKDLAAGEFISVTVTFAPGATGTFAVDLPVTRTPPKGDAKLICSGKAVAGNAAFSLTPGLLDFNTILVGATSAPKVVTIKNTGTTAISVSVAGAPAGAAFQWTGFSGPLTCGQQQPISVTFTPAAVGPTSPQTITVVSATAGSKSVALAGAGCVPNAIIATPPAPFPGFGDVRQSYRMPRVITVRNTGEGPLTFTASISGPDAALFGLMKPSQSITDVTPSRIFQVSPVQACGGGPTGNGAQDVVVIFLANTTPPAPAAATLTIDAHNHAGAPASFAYPLSANVIAGNTVDVIAVFDRSGSMSDVVPGGGTKMAAAIAAGRLLTKLIPPDLNNRIAATLFNTTASTFLPIQEVTAANQQSKADALADPPLTPAGGTAIVAGAMTGLSEFDTPHAGGVPANLTKSMIVLTDGKDNTAFKNPADGQLYTITGVLARDPANPSELVPTHAFVPPTGVKIYAIGLGTEQSIDKAQLDQLASGTNASYNIVDPTKPAVTYELMKLFTQIYMDMVDMSAIKDPRQTIWPGQKHENEFDLLRGDVGAIAVIYDLGGLRLPFYFVSPQGELIDANFAPAAFQLRSGFTESTRFLEFRVPVGEPDRYAGRWRLVVEHKGIVCRGIPIGGDDRRLGFLPRACSETKEGVEYGFAIGAGSNFRLQAYVSPGPVNVGEPIRLTAVVTEAGLEVTGCTVTVDAQSPGGATWSGLVLRDDGAHQDGDPDDGEYARLFTQTAEAGSYTFTFRVTGKSRDGEAVMREAVRSKYVTGHVRNPPQDPTGGDQCCKRIVTLLERQTKVMQALLEEARHRPTE